MLLYCLTILLIKSPWNISANFTFISSGGVYSIGGLYKSCRIFSNNQTIPSGYRIRTPLIINTLDYEHKWDAQERKGVSHFFEFWDNWNSKFVSQYNNEIKRL